MNTNKPENGRRIGYTLIEVLMVMLIIMILAALLLPAVQRSLVKARQTQCLSNLRQVGVAFQSFAHDHGGQFPMRIPIRQGGSMEANRQTLSNHASLSFSPWHFKVMSNELGSTKVVLCPADKRSAAKSFAQMQMTNISYWVNARALPGNSVQFLSGDRNLVGFLARTNRTGQAPPPPEARFTGDLHRFRGNVLFADGHVELLGTGGGASGGGGGEGGSPPAGPSGPGASSSPNAKDAPPKTPPATPSDDNGAANPAPATLPPDESAKPPPPGSSDAPEPAPDKGNQPDAGSPTSQSARSTAAASAGRRPSPPAGSPDAAPPAAVQNSQPFPVGEPVNLEDFEDRDDPNIFGITILRHLAITLYLLVLILLILLLTYRYLTRKKRGKPSGSP